MGALLLSGGIFHDFDAMAAVTAGLLAEEGLPARVVTSPSALAAALAAGPVDLVVVQALRWRMLGHEKYEPYRAEWAYETGADLVDALTAHHARGGGLLSVHTGCICFDDWPGWRELIGGGWVWGESFHAPGVEPVAVRPVAGHPVTAGVPPFTVTDEHYRALDIAPGSVVLAHGIAGAGDAYPVAWASDAGDGTGRAVAITTGHDAASLAEPGQARLVRQAARWAAGQERGAAA